MQVHCQRLNIILQGEDWVRLTDQHRGEEEINRPLAIKQIQDAREDAVVALLFHCGIMSDGQIWVDQSSTDLAVAHWTNKPR